MKILTHKVENVFSHESRVIDLSSASLIGITGPIGSGKSTLMRSVGANLTGEWGVKSERVMTLGQKTCSVETTVAIRPGLTITVSRDLKRKKATLKYSDGRPDVEGADAVTACVLTELGVDKTILREVVFVGQEEINNLLFAKDSAKDRLAAKFFGVERSVSIEKSLSNMINDICLTVMVESVGEIHAKIRKATSGKHDAQNALEDAGVPDIAMSQMLQSQLQSFLAAGKTTEARREYARRKQELELKTEELVTANTILEDSIASIPVGKLREKLLIENEKSRKHALLENLNKDVVRFHDELAKLGAAAPCSSQTIEDLEREVERISREESVGESTLKLRQAILEDIRQHGRAVCDTCESEIDDHQSDRIAALVEKTQEVTRDYGRLTSLKKNLADKRRQLSEWEKQTITARTRLAEAKESIIDLGDSDGPGDPQKWNSMIVSYDQMRQDLASGVAELQKNQRALSSLIEPPELTGSFPDDFDASDAQKRITEIQKQEEQVRSIRNQILLSEKEIELLTKQLELAQEAEAANVVQSELRASLSLIRERFHPDGAPKVLIERRVKRMEERINDYLALLESKFSIRVSEAGGFNFEAIFPNKPGAIMASELSGGEKASLSISFRLAAIEGVCSSVGLLVLDEPTAAFGVEEIEHFGKVLERLKVLAKSLDLQVCVITHSKQLEEHFEQLIQL